MVVKPALYQMLTFPLRVLVIAISLIEATVRPVYRPIVAAVAALGLFAWLEQRIAAMPRLAILILLGVPFAIAEPAKVVAVILIARGHVLVGTFALVLAYLATFLIVERIYHAGREKLLTYPWFAWMMHYAGLARAFYERMRQATRTWLRTIKDRLL